MEADPEDVERCAEKTRELAAECAPRHDEPGAERCEQRAEAPIAECPAACACDALDDAREQALPVEDRFGTCRAGLVCCAGGCCVAPSGGPLSAGVPP